METFVFLCSLKVNVFNFSHLQFMQHGTYFDDMPFSYWLKIGCWYIPFLHVAKVSTIEEEKFAVLHTQYLSALPAALLLSVSALTHSE